VRRDLWRGARALFLPTLAVLTILAFLPGWLDVAIRVYALAVSGATLAVMVAALRRAYPPTRPLRTAGRRLSGARRESPAMLARLEQEVVLGSAGSFDLHHQLRPRLRGLAAELLTTRRRLSLDGDADHARELLGEETWGLVHKERLPPEDRLSRGMPPEALNRVVTSLERI